MRHIKNKEISYRIGDIERHTDRPRYFLGIGSRPGNPSQYQNRSRAHKIRIMASHVGSMWPCSPLRSPRCSLRSSWCLSRSPAVPSGPRGVSVPSGPFGVPPYSPACPPVPLVSLGSYSGVAQHGDSLGRPAAAAPFPGVLLPAVRWLSSLAVAHACIHTQQ